MARKIIGTACDHCCCNCHGGTVEFARTMRPKRQEHPSEDRRRQLANHFVRFGMPTEVAAKLFNIAPRATSPAED